MPSPLTGKKIQSPEVLIVALGCDNGFSARNAGQVACQFVAASHVPGEYGYHKFAGTIHVHHRRIVVFVSYLSRNTTYTDA